LVSSGPKEDLGFLAAVGDFKMPSRARIERSLELIVLSKVLAYFLIALN